MDLKGEDYQGPPSDSQFPILCCATACRSLSLCADTYLLTQTFAMFPVHGYICTEVPAVMVRKEKLNFCDSASLVLIWISDDCGLPLYQIPPTCAIGRQPTVGWCPLWQTNFICLIRAKCSGHLLPASS